MPVRFLKTVSLNLIHLTWVFSPSRLETSYSSTSVPWCSSELAHHSDLQMESMGRGKMCMVHGVFRPKDLSLIP